MACRQGAELTTPRGVLRPIGADDEAELHALWSSPGIRRFLWDGEVIPVERTRAAIEQSQQMFRDQGVGLWGVRPTALPGLGGFAGLWFFRHPPELELLYGVAEPLWGNGYATEAARAVITYCFDVLDFPLVRASTDAANTPSIRVLEKLGFDFVRFRVVAGLDTKFYVLARRPHPPGPSGPDPIREGR
jgi:RimJ/RimL family protein N-acetyltransferase